MARQIKCLWMRIGTMFLTLYFMPLSNFIMSIFGIKHSGQAAAGYVTCAGSTSTSVYCSNGPSGNIVEGDKVTCLCENSSGLYFDMRCDVNSWRDAYSNVVSQMTWTNVKGTCAKECTSGQTRSCTSGAFTGTQNCDTKYGSWGSCEKSGCASGYIMVSGKCYASCNVSNGTGYKRGVNDESSSSSNA